MDEPDHLLFTSLFKEAYEKCFVQEIRTPLTETESKLFSNQLLERTGLTVGWRTLKNFSFYVLDVNGKKENPSLAIYAYKIAQILFKRRCGKRTYHSARLECIGGDSINDYH